MPSDRLPTLTASSYAVLSLLCVQPWSAYDLANQMQRSMGWYWPRASSGVYQEPKKLASHGFVTARSEPTGRRPRTVYEVTPAGRAAMAAWLAESPSEPPELQSEQLIRIFMPDAGDRELLLTNLRGFSQQVAERISALHEQLTSYDGPAALFPQRRFSQLLAGRLLVAHLEALAGWAAWAIAEVERWPGDSWQDASDASHDALISLVREAAGN